MTTTTELTDVNKRLCWRTEAFGIVSFVAATTRGKAIAATKLAADDVGYNPAWKDIKAHRAPEYDLWAAMQTRSNPTTEWFVRQELVQESYQALEGTK